MLTHIEHKTLPYTPEQMYNLVVAVDKYKEFLPWCVASRINKRETPNDDEGIFYADLIVGYKLLREKFSSKVTHKPPSHEHPGSIEIEYLRGPLKHLKNHWEFIREPNGSCLINFNVEFEFKNMALQGLAQVFFQEVIKRMVGAFETRAHEIYGNPSTSSSKAPSKNG